MSKKRRTKKEKLIAQERRESQPTFTYSLNTSFPEKTETIKPTHSVEKNTHNYSYVLTDVRKTIIVIASILTVNTILYFVMQSNIVSIPFIGV